MTATYWVFGGEVYEEIGGVRDLMGVYESEADAQMAVDNHEMKDRYKWAEWVKVIDGVPEGHFLIRSTAK